jgi:hypothetical protein
MPTIASLLSAGPSYSTKGHDRDDFMQKSAPHASDMIRDAVLQSSEAHNTQSQISSVQYMSDKEANHLPGPELASAHLSGSPGECQQSSQRLYQDSDNQPPALNVDYTSASRKKNAHRQGQAQAASNYRAGLKAKVEALEVAVQSLTREVVELRNTIQIFLP